MAHQAAAETILRYLKGTTEWGIRYGGPSPLTGYSDADFAGDIDTRRSTTRFAFLLNAGAVFWQSPVHPTVVTSTSEAEYISAVQDAREAVLLKLLMADVVGKNETVCMRCVSQSALRLDNPAGTARRKHNDVSHHFVRNSAARGDLRIEYVSCADMLADGHTKALPVHLLSACREGLGIVDIGINGGLRGSARRAGGEALDPEGSCSRCGTASFTASPP